MRRLFVILTIVLSLFGAIGMTGCGSTDLTAPKPPSSTEAIVRVHASAVTVTTVDAVKVWTWTAAYNEWQRGRWFTAVKAAISERAAAAPRITTVNQRPVVVHAYAQYPASYQPCGGTDYPPCWRVGTESGGNYNAYNPTGCGGHGCFGKWQFSGEWACKLGLPCDLRTATPAQQDNAARALWNHGAGCANWAAC